MAKKWSRREEEVMGMLGLKRQPGSGSGWLKKEDGEGDDILAQLKSTEGKSIAIKADDVKELLYHAYVSHKLPVFVVDFMEEGFMLVATRIEDMPSVAKALTKSINRMKKGVK